jgi:outer membrane protein assembly factor BamB
LAAALLLSACGSSPKPSAQAIGDVKVEQALAPAWSVKLAGDTALNQSLPIQDGQLAMVSKNGHVHVVRADTGRLVWQLALKTDLNTGAGFDGRNVAVVTRSNELVAVADGKVSWRTRLTAQSYTNPLVAGERVFVLLADRSVAAFDLATGQRLWVQQRSGEALVLKQNGVLMAFQNNLLAGLGGKLVALNPDNGQVRWEVPIANPRGINDLERLVDLVASPSRLNNSVCVRAFQAQVGCVDALRGALLWTRPANGVQGVGGDGTAPLWTSKGVVVGDAGGYLYVLSGQDGRLMNKLKTPASGFASSPTALPDGGFVVLTRNGLLQAYQLP